MKYKAVYTITWTGSLPAGFNERLVLSFPEGEFCFTEFEADEKRAQAEVRVPVSAEALILRAEPPTLDGSPTQESIVVQETTQSSEVVQTATWVLAFLTDVPFRHSVRLGQDGLIAESPEDEELLERFGTNRIWHQLMGRGSMRSFSMPDLSDEKLLKLVSRRFGLALYTEALLLQRPIGRYRELWRLLESAFGMTDGDLVRAVAGFPPAQSLGYTESELQEMLVLRGRASHAESRIGLAEHRRVTKEVEERLPRLKCLAEQLLITKKTWGTKGNGVDRIAEIKAFIDKAGVLNIIKSASGGA